MSTGIVGATAAGAAAISFGVLVYYVFLQNTTYKKTSASCRRRKSRRNGLIDAVGNTPLIRINSLSDATGCEILGKAEFLNPGGSVKDRVAVKIIEEALEYGALVRGGVITEGSAGSTAISLATVAPAYGCKCHVVIPDDAAAEKVNACVINCSSLSVKHGTKNGSLTFIKVASKKNHQSFKKYDGYLQKNRK
ncbi:hypothetical protein ZOSMA_410G00080 [Zostera marina]|uniref:cysteine synthase n=1 Tax=Zostera marina TaxID=29655 RepID=A0A0K9P308_ZOSMR|nr:hypothetical protein ZOSMA_410G00080 [Zostera marina]